MTPVHVVLWVMACWGQGECEKTIVALFDSVEECQTEAPATIATWFNNHPRYSFDNNSGCYITAPDKAAQP